MIKLLNILKEIGDASAEPFNWSRKGNFDSIINKLIKKADKVKDEYWEDDTEFNYIANSSNARYNIDIKVNVWRWPKTDKTKLDADANISFSVGESEKLTNFNEQYRVLSTVVECVKDFVKGVNKFIDIKEIYIFPKSDKDRSRKPSLNSKRGKFYIPYAEKAINSLPGSWDVDFDPSGIVITNMEWKPGKKIT